MSESSSCLFCLKKTSSLKNKLTADVLKDLDLFQFLCKYLIHQNDFDNSIRYNFDSIEEGMLPVCTKCSNLYKQLAELYSEFQELETQIKSVVEEFRNFVLSSSSAQSGHQDGLDTFHRSFRQQVLKLKRPDTDNNLEEFNPDINIKEELIVPDEPSEMEINGIMAMSMDVEEHKVEPIEEYSDNPNDEDFDFLPNNDDELDQEVGFKSGDLKTDDYFEEPRRSLRSRDVPLSIQEKPKKIRAKKRENVTKTVKKVAKIEPTSDSNNSSPPPIRKRGRPIGQPNKRKKTSIFTPLRGRKRKERKRYICSVESCGIEFDHRTKLRKHLNKHEAAVPEEEKNLCCSYCPKKFIIKKVFDYHVSLHKLEEDKNQEVFICKECDVRCLSQETLNVHISTLHQKGIIKYVCNICGNQFTTKLGFDRHLEAHAGIKPKPTPCKYCPAEFVYHNQLKQHEFQKHPEHAKVYECKFCGNKYHSNSLLQDHLKSHSTEKTKECTLCHEKFKTLQGLNGHMIKSHGKEHYTCKICEDKKFTSKTGFLMHNRIHHNQGKLRFYDCTQCEKKFTSKSKLDRHILSHGEARNSICEICGKGFKSPDALYNHRNFYHLAANNQRYKCEVCFKTFSWHTSHRVHMKSHHGIEIPTKNRKQSTSAATAPSSASDSVPQLAPDSAITPNVAENLAIPPTHDQNLMNLSSHMPSLYFNYF